MESLNMPITTDRIITIKLNRVWEIVANKFTESEQDIKDEVNLLIKESKYYSNQICDDNKKKSEREIKREKFVAEVDNELRGRDIYIKRLKSRIENLESELETVKGSLAQLSDAAAEEEWDLFEGDDDDDLFGTDVGSDEDENKSYFGKKTEELLAPILGKK